MTTYIIFKEIKCVSFSQCWYQLCLQDTKWKSETSYVDFSKQPASELGCEILLLYLGYHLKVPVPTGNSGKQDHGFA